jgi:hypothetical protein
VWLRCSTDEVGHVEPNTLTQPSLGRKQRKTTKFVGDWPPIGLSEEWELTDYPRQTHVDDSFGIAPSLLHELIIERVFGKERERRVDGAIRLVSVEGFWVAVEDLP